MDANVAIKLYYEEILDNREVHCQASRVYGKGYVANVQRSSPYISQTSPCLWCHTRFGFFEGDPSSLWYELEARNVHKKATNVCLFLYMCFQSKSSFGSNNGMNLMFWERQKNSPSRVFNFEHSVWLFTNGSIRLPFGTRVGKHL